MIRGPVRRSSLNLNVQTNHIKKILRQFAKLLPLLYAVIHDRSTTFIRLSYIYRLLSTIGSEARSKAREKGNESHFGVSFLRQAFLRGRQLESFWIFRSFQRGTLSTRIGVRAKFRTARVPWSRDPRRLRLLDLVPLLARLPPPPPPSPPSLLRSPMFRVSCTAARTCNNSHLRMARVSDGRAYERAGHWFSIYL